MAQERIRQWALRVVPEKPDDNEHRTKRIRMQTDSAILDTWEAPFPGREQWCDEMEALLEVTAEQLPVRRHTVTFTAEDANGQPLSTQATTIQGKNKDANDFANGNSVKALAESMNSLAVTMEKILASSRLQVECSTKALEAAYEEVREMHRLNRAHRAIETVGATPEAGALDSEMLKSLVGELKQYGPAALELATMWLQTKGATGATPAINAITNAVKTVTNGKAS